jgi:NADH dehydrogenase FAD-containing subunit
MQLAIHEVLRNKGITVLQDTVTSIEIDQVHLGCGARLACDVPLLATGVTPPAWLADSGLALDANGFVAVDAYQQSTSHSCVFAAGDVSTRTDRALARNGVYATLAGPALLRNLGAATSGAALKAHKPPARSLQLLSCGGHYAIALWGKHSFKGYWVWWLKHWMDRKFVSAYTDNPK